jgi:stress-induced morphogen
MAIKKELIYDLIVGVFPEAKIHLEDIVGDNNHYELKIYSKDFKNLSLIEQHRLIYKALDAVIGRELHALKINIIENDEDF